MAAVPAHKEDTALNEYVLESYVPHRWAGCLEGLRALALGLGAGLCVRGLTQERKVSGGG